MSDEKRCFNCKQTEAMNRPVFCDDCWRMAIITSALGASVGEIVHKILGAMFLSALLLVALPASAQTLADNGEGRVRVAGNELLVESKVLDPSAIRLRAPADQGGSGKISFDAGTTEHTLLIGAQSPGRGGEFSLNLLIPGGSSTDDAMFKALRVTHEDGFHFRLPLHFDAGGGSSGGDSISAGAFRLYQQGDGNVVSYELVQGILCARWSIWTGLIPKHTAVGVCRQ